MDPIGICILIMFVFFLMGALCSLTYSRGRKDERERFEKEAIHHGFGTYEPNDNSEVFSGIDHYTFEWKDITIKDHYVPEIGV